MFGKMIRLSEFWRSGFKCEDLMLLHLHLQILDGRMLKPNDETCLKCKFKLEQNTLRREKLLELIKSAYFEKWV